MFSIFVSLTVSVLILGYMLISMSSVSVISDEWSFTTLKFASRYPELRDSIMMELLPPNVFYHTKPYESVVYSFFINEAYYMLNLMIMLWVKINKRGSLSIFVTIAILGAGYASLYFGGAAKWTFPMAHTIECLHFAKALRTPKMPIMVSILYFCILIAIFVTLSIRSMKKFDFMELDE